MSKNVMIPFSGGLDSTYLMWKNLKDGNRVHPVYFDVTNNERKSIVEKQQIRLIEDELQREFDTGINTEYITKFGVETFRSIVNFPQPMMWAISLPFGVEEKTDEIQIGYVMGDDATLYTKEIKRLYYSTKPFSRHTPKLTFPLLKEKLHKVNLIDELPEPYHKLITSCEDPRLLNFGYKQKYSNRVFRGHKPCCDCVPCRKIISNDFFGSRTLAQRYERPLYEKKKREVLQYENRFAPIDLIQKANII